MIRGIGPVYAKKLVRAFAEAVFEIIEQEPHRLREVTGIGPKRAERIIAALDGLPLAACVGTGRAQVGGGTLPRSVLPSLTIDLAHRTLKPQEMAARLRDQATPLIGYITRGTLKLDLRTIFPRQDEALFRAVHRAFENRASQ